MRRWREALGAAALLAAVGVADAAPLPVEAVNASRPTQCAETDNVDVKLFSPQVRRFTIEAVHPAYLQTMTSDDKAPDFGKCDMGVGPVFRATPREVMLYEDAKWQLRGFTYPAFWRRARVPVRIGTRVETGLHLLQLWTRGRLRNEEVLVLYPADGYWRARPLAPSLLGWQPDPLLPTAYGPSFLVGPIQQKRRPLVDIKEVTFDPRAGTFHLAFVRGGGATLKIAVVSDEKTLLEISLEKGISGGPFAALRSMYVSADNADVSEVSWRDGRGTLHDAVPVMKFRRAGISQFRAGRRKPSRHNTSAPDMVFRDFRIWCSGIFGEAGSLRYGPVPGHHRQA